ncbi:DinB family protein [Tepidiforma thermophila]|uniref:DinB family protein n=1 Tax=Tepidiforma thermophila (strain KCTC 52669 / CGMCC 1.13589 / G233) TaxID=2761530 RepID=A0A2A9HHG7_TEPT2|nr:DinB family protein [Tepidiforma thermophila]PFG74259.1 DinB family protein [Tepidiforma thermophila]
MNMRVQLVIDEFNRHRRQFEHLCRQLTPEELQRTVPGSHWTVKDYIAHLCTIDGLIVPRFAAMVGRQAPLPDTPIPNPFDIDDWNEAAVRSRAERGIEELLAEAATHRERLLRAVAEFTDAHLDQEILYGGDRKALGIPPSRVRFGGLLWGVAIHDPTHTRDILRALPHRAEEPWIQEWLGSVSDALVPQGVREQRV